MQCFLGLHLSLVCGSQVADFREQLLSYAGVDPARIVEFSCGKCAGVTGRGHNLCWTICHWCCFVSTLSNMASFLEVTAAKGCLFPPTELLSALGQQQ